MTGSQMKQWEIYFRQGISTAPAELMPSASKAQGSSIMIIFDDIDDFAILITSFDYDDDQSKLASEAKVKAASVVK